MNFFLFVLLVIAAIMAAIIYKNRDKIRIHPMFRSLILRQKLIIDIHNTGYWKQNNKNCTIRPDIVWKRARKSDLTYNGYYKFVDFLHGWKYIGTECYVRFWNMRVFDVEKWNDEHPNEEDKLNDMRSYNLYDYFRSKVVDKFLRGYSKLSFFNGTDSSRIMIVIIVGGGIVLGLWFLLRSNGMI